ncbi:MAG: L-threonylcarbamoyladenylate synthase [Acidobacteriota bacterium]|nr:MAG: threonylcarbamoyl-AMP synthase [Acidobacteriota bacterium]
MGVRLTLHPETPQQRFIRRAGEVLREGGVAIVPTDSSYALVAEPRSKAALERIARLKRFHPERKLFSLLVPDLAEIATYALVSNRAYRILRHFLPGPYTFVLPASRQVPKVLQTKRKTIGLRVPDEPISRQVAREAGGALLATTARLPDDEYPLADPDEIERRLGPHVDLFLDHGWGGVVPTTLVDLSDGDEPVLLREGAGDPEPFRS